MSYDQAKNLRELVKSEAKCKTIFFMSGKERVGQTMTITNLATLLSENNYSTLILDSGTGFFRTDLLLNVMPKYGIRASIINNEPVEDMMVPINDKLKVLYTRTLFEELETSEEMLNKLEENLEKFKEDFDFILIDLEQINLDSIKSLITADNTEILFTLNTDDLECLKQTYAIIKKIESNANIKKVNIIINKVTDIQRADDFYQRLKIASDKFLGVEVESIGYISNDTQVGESLKEQIPIVNLYKESKVSNELKEIFSNIILN